MKNPFRSFTKFEYGLWLFSLVGVVISFALSLYFGETINHISIISFIISAMGVTALVFNAKGMVEGQVLSVIFSLLYGYVSFHQRYYGEMITYMGMTMPIAAASVYTWLRNPDGDSGEVKIKIMRKRDYALTAVLTILVTISFYFILKALGTSSLIAGTFSVTTSFSASYLTMMRCPLYAVCYSANDIILIFLWTVATVKDISNLPMVICFIMFLFNDIYGFISWKRRLRKQIEEATKS
ncbi:MAG: nicotinamide riboside transporter PnuC [Clostridia bacterium]|nr:nicotinamide riboside transporter PnuC [Clostridia bacterium]